MTFRTALCDLLGLEYPIVQSGMGAIAGPKLVAEVCRGGRSARWSQRFTPNGRSR